MAHARHRGCDILGHLDVIAFRCHIDVIEDITQICRWSGIQEYRWNVAENISAALHNNIARALPENIAGTLPKNITGLLPHCYLNVT